jgi:hypothetical protein
METEQIDRNQLIETINAQRQSSVIDLLNSASKESVASLEKKYGLKFIRKGGKIIRAEAAQ